jgi:hypothetical protein
MMPPMTTVASGRCTHAGLLRQTARLSDALAQSKYFAISVQAGAH